MSRKRKYLSEQIVQICSDYLSGTKSATQLCIEHGLSSGKPPGLFWNWVAKYRANGSDAFMDRFVNSSYTSGFKIMVVEEYTNGFGSLNDLCSHYKILSSWR